MIFSSFACSPFSDAANVTDKVSYVKPEELGVTLGLSLAYDGVIKDGEASHSGSLEARLRF